MTFDIPDSIRQLGRQFCLEYGKLLKQGEPPHIAEQIVMNQAKKQSRTQPRRAQEKIEVPEDVRRAGKRAVREFRRLRRRGESQSIAEMIVLRRWPSVVTDTVIDRDLYANHRRLMDTVGPDVASEAPSAGKAYVPSIAAFPGDPDAYVTGIDDVRRLCKHRGWSYTMTSDGIVCSSDGPAREWKKRKRSRRKGRQ